MNKKVSFAAFCLLFTLTLTNAAAVYAAQKTSLLTQATPSRFIAYNFHKMTNTAPDFDRAIRSLDKFKKATQAEQAHILSQERARYDVEYAGTDPRHSIIVTRAAVTLRPDLTGPLMRVSLPTAQGSMVYFPYLWADQNFALIPHQIEKFLAIPMSMNEMSAASAKLSGNGGATMVVEMKPLSADATKPMPLDNVPQWLLMTRIVAVTFYNGYLETIWAWQADDYKRPGYAPIEGLKK